MLKPSHWPRGLVPVPNAVELLDRTVPSAALKLKSNVVGVTLRMILRAVPVEVSVRSVADAAGSVAMRR